MVSQNKLVRRCIKLNIRTSGLESSKSFESIGRILFNMIRYPRRPCWLQYYKWLYKLCVTINTCRAIMMNKLKWSFNSPRQTRLTIYIGQDKARQCRARPLLSRPYVTTLLNICQSNPFKFKISPLQMVPFGLSGSVE